MPSPFRAFLIGLFLAFLAAMVLGSPSSIRAAVSPRIPKSSLLPDPEPHRHRTIPAGAKLA